MEMVTISKAEYERLKGCEEHYDNMLKIAMRGIAASCEDNKRYNELNTRYEDALIELGRLPDNGIFGSKKHCQPVGGGKPTHEHRSELRISVNNIR